MALQTIKRRLYNWLIINFEDSITCAKRPWCCALVGTLEDDVHEIDEIREFNFASIAIVCFKKINYLIPSITFS